MFFEISKIIGFFAQPSNALFLLVAVGVVLALFGLRGFGLWMTAIAVLALGIGGYSPLANILLLPLEDRFPPFVDDGRPVAGVVILGGANDTVGARRPGVAVNEAAERLAAGAALARRYPDARIVHSGGDARLFGGGINEAELARRYLQTTGLPPDRIIYEDRARNTAENAVFTRELVRPAPGERWLLVTSAWHMPRSIGAFRAAGFDVIPYPVDYRTRGPEDRQVVFGTLSGGLRRLDVAANEWVGLIAYRLTGRTDALFPAP